MFPEPVITIKNITDQRHFIGGTVWDNFVSIKYFRYQVDGEYFEFHYMRIFIIVAF